MRILTSYYIESRYPAGSGEFTRDESEYALDAAYSMIQFVKDKIKEITDKKEIDE